MDWVSGLDHIPLVEVELVDPPVDTGRLIAWLIMAGIALTGAAIWYRHRIVRRSFWCATVGRDVEVHFRHGCVLSCPAFEDPRAIACARRCLDRSFRVQWPPALPLLTRQRGTAPLGELGLEP